LAGLTAATLAHHRDILLVLVSKELKLRYKNTFLGYAWSVLHPLAMAMVFYLVFKVFMKIRMEDYSLFLITGLFAWQWFQNSLGASSAVFLNNSTLIRKVRFPRSYLVLAGVLNDLFHYAVSIPVILAFMLYSHRYPSVAWIWGIPLLLGIQLMLTYGIALLVATGNLFFRDLERLTLILTMLWLYLTPVIYPVSMVPERWRWGLYVNPVAPLIVGWRSLFMEGTLSFDLTVAGLGWAVLLMIVGYHTYRAVEWRFAELV
jgi:lipopolysaccharide transport system permease protein